MIERLAKSPYRSKQYTEEQRNEIASTIAAGGGLEGVHKLISKWRPGVSLAAAAKMVQRMNNKPKPKHLGQHHSRQEMTLIRKMFKTGQNDKEILKALRQIRPDATQNTIYYMRSKMKLYRIAPKKRFAKNITSEKQPLQDEPHRQSTQAEIIIRTSQTEMRQLVNNKTAKAVIELLLGI